MKCKHSLKAILVTRSKVFGMAFRRPLVGHPTKCRTRVTMENDLWDGFLSSKIKKTHGKYMEKHIIKKHPSGPVYCISSLFRCRGTAQHSAGLGRFGG